MVSLFCRRPDRSLPHPLPRARLYAATVRDVFAESHWHGWPQITGYNAGPVHHRRAAPPEGERADRAIHAQG